LAAADCSMSCSMDSPPSAAATSSSSAADSALREVVCTGLATGIGAAGAGTAAAGIAGVGTADDGPAGGGGADVLNIKAVMSALVFMKHPSEITGTAAAAARPAVRRAALGH